MGAPVLLAVGLLSLSVGCAPLKPTRVASVALTLQDVAAAASRQSDPAIVADGSPAYLMLVEGLIEAYPQNRDLLLAAGQAYASYAASFVMDEDPERAGRLFLRAKEYGFQSLSHRGDFSRAAKGNVDEFKAFLAGYGKRDVPALFWTANAWANWIGLNLGKVEAIADLPALEALMARVLELDDGFYYGSPHLLLGVYEASKPATLGGSLKKAGAHFEQAFERGADKLLTSKVLFAEYYARAMKDEKLFVETLEGVLASEPGAIPELTLSNILAQQRAEKLLSKREVYFEEIP